MQQITLDNFRVFNSAAAFDLAPVTVLTGKNNSGKSSLIKAFLVLADFLDSKDQTTLRLDGANAAKHRISSFASLRNRTSSSSLIKLGYTNGDFEFEYEFSEHLDPTKAALLRFTMRAKPLGESLVLQRISQSRGIYELQVSQTFVDFLTAEDKEKVRILNEGQYERELARAKEELDFFGNGPQRVMDANGDMEYVSSSWIEPGSPLAEMFGMNDDNVIVERQRLQKRIKDLQKMIGVAKTNAGITFVEEVALDADGLHSLTITDLLQEALATFIRADEARRVKLFKFQDAGKERRLLIDFRKRVAELMAFSPYHLGPNRTHQARLFIPQQGSSEIGAVAQAFVRARVVPKSTADTFLQTWLDRFDMGKRLLVSPVQDTGYTIDVFLEAEAENSVSLADLGFGAGQLLAILLHIATVIQEQETQTALRGKQQPPHLVLIEEPEANLHPRLQSKLAELFVEVAHTHQLPVLVETHSEYLIRKMQLMVASGACTPEAIVVHYLDPAGNRHITITADGKLSEPFGSGFFDEAGEETLALHRLQRKNLRA